MGMKRYKITTINSYASYKQNKKRSLVTTISLLVSMGILMYTFFSGTFMKDMRSFLLANGLNLFDMQKNEPSEHFDLPQGEICYSYYVTPKESKGIYVPGRKLDQLDEYIKLARETQVNCFVIDVKDD